ncbi:MAG: aldose 1-epimerase family protein [Frankia sp.]
MEISGDGQTATIVGVGGGLRGYSAAGVAILDGYGPDEMCSGGRGQILMPWPNRVAGGRYRFGGHDYQLDLTEPARGNAIHGLTRWAEWDLEPTGPATATARHRLAPRPSYPFRLGCQADYSLGPDGLTVRLSITNLGATAAPVAIGMHPYLTVGTSSIDAASIEVPAATTLVNDDAGIPVGSRPVAGTAVDFSTSRPIGPVRLDTAYTDLIRDPDGRARLRLGAAPGDDADVEPGAGRQVVLWVDETFRYLQIFTGDTLPEPVRRRGVAVEPMTAPANALRSGVGLTALEPGATYSGSWGIDPRG